MHIILFMLISGNSVAENPETVKSLISYQFNLWTCLKHLKSRFIELLVEASSGVMVCLILIIIEWVNFSYDIVLKVGILIHLFSN